jgi:hypothetical protein
MRRIFALHLIIGISLILLGFVAQARPYVLLDVVLTQQELHDGKKIDDTLATLQRGAGSDAAWLFGTGTILTVTSLIGVFGSRRVQATKS